MTILMIARHGNTFDKGETPRRVGCHTDLPLSTSGIKQAKLLGQFCQENNYLPDNIYASELIRTKQTALYAFPDMPIKTLPLFNEIDYGPDENKTEPEVIARISQDAIDLWNQKAIVPTGWQVDPSATIQGWHDFSNQLLAKRKNITTLVVTSNGVARFSPYITGDFEQFSKNYPIKISTGALCIFHHDGYSWKVVSWNLIPKQVLAHTNNWV